MEKEIKEIIYKYSKKGGMSDEIEDGQIIGIKTGKGKELDIIGKKIASLYKTSLVKFGSRDKKQIKFKALFGGKVVELIKWQDGNWMYSEDGKKWYFKKKYAHSQLKRV